VGAPSAEAQRTRWHRGGPGPAQLLQPAQQIADHDDLFDHRVLRRREDQYRDAPVRLQELVIPPSIGSTTAVLTASHIPKSSQSTILTPVAAGKPVTAGCAASAARTGDPCESAPA
jgi:hypothetical protein